MRTYHRISGRVKNLLTLMRFTGRRLGAVFAQVSTALHPELRPKALLWLMMLVVLGASAIWGKPALFKWFHNGVSAAPVDNSLSSSAAAPWVRNPHLSSGPRLGKVDPGMLNIEPPAFSSAPTNLRVTAAANQSISLAWDAPTTGTFANYRIERGTSLTGTFSFVANTNSSTTTYTDTSMGTGVHSYLYRVRTVSIFGNMSTPTNLAMGTTISFTDPALTAGVTEIKAQHIYDLRQAVNAVRAIAGQSGGTWTTSTLEQQIVKAVDVQELRDQLDAALDALQISTPDYTDNTLATGANGTLIKKVHIEELRTRSTKAQSSSSGPADAFIDSSTARLDPLNRTGGGGDDPLSRNINWSVPLVSLPGRSGLDLGLSLSYNSLATWTKHGDFISFDDDYGRPAPGFRIGFPVIEEMYYNWQAGKNSFLMITPSGARVELRQIGSSGLYQSVDSSYMLLDSSTMILKTTDGTQLSYTWKTTNYECTQIKDRNGNYISISYNTAGRISTVTDTLNRTITFNYSNGDLTSITQTWGSSTTHDWARFTYGNQTIQTNFSGLTVYGPANSTSIRVLTQVKFADDSYFQFDYTSWGQVWKISQYTGESTPTLLNYRSYNLPADTSGGAQSDCPRFTQRKDWAKYWNRDSNGTEQEVMTSFDAPTSVTIPDTSQTGLMAKVTQTDGTYQKLYYGSSSGSPAWQHGLIRRTEAYEYNNSTAQRVVATNWTQDDTNVSYQINPRVTDTIVSDQSNYRKTSVSYASTTVSGGTIYLPENTIEYDADTTTQLRRTNVSYNLDSAYTSRRIIGLVSERKLYSGPSGSETLMAKMTYAYDGSGSIDGNDAPVQHDSTNYTSSLVTGRGNVTSVTRHNVLTTSLSTTSTVKYNTAGSVVQTTDPLSHSVSISYTDQFSANGTDLDSSLGFSTLAYPTTVTDAGGFTSTMRYNYAFGGNTRKQTPMPNYTTNQAGPIQITEYDSIGRLQKVRNTFNSAYTRSIYHPTYVETYSTVNSVDDEAHSMQFFDGAGRVIGTASNHPNSTGGYSGQQIFYNNMGRVVKTSNPTETSASGVNPYSWTATGDDSSAGWKYTQQSYDWKGRPLVTTNPDDTTKTASYAGCGCAGGVVVTLTDEGTIDGGTAKRRQQKIYADVFGRTVKTEILNWENGSVYSTTVNTYNARDQITLVRQYQGNTSGSTYQDTTISYDGYGRLSTKHLPEQQDQNGNPTYTTWTYDDDDSIASVIDARGVTVAYSYNSRRLLTGIDYPSSLPTGVTATADVSFTYDAARNRLSISDGLGSKSYSYNDLSQLMSETRTFNDPNNSAINNVAKTLSYDYNLAGELKKITDSTGMTINYGYNSAGLASSVTGADNLFMDISDYASNFQYRAWGGLKAMTDGSNHTSSFLYNAKLQPTHFDISGDLVNQNYDYYNDGRISFVENTTDAKFDRAYSYDHMARYAEAKTGGQARGDSGDSPYYESFNYDAFSNLTGRQTNNWDQEQMSDEATYADNRRDGWGYDADGNNTTLGSRSYTFDAAGQMTLMTGQKWVINHYVSTSESSGYDGDGVKVKSVGGGVTSYYLRASALHGAIIEEIGSTGQKTVGYVYTPGGEALARQTPAGSSSYVTWKHTTPAATGEHDYRVGGVFGSGSPSRIELDPLGAKVPLEYTPPPEVQGSGDLGQIGGIFDSRWSNFFDLSGGCSMEGVGASCSDGMSALNNLGVMRPNLILVTIKIKWKDANKKPQTIQFVTTSSVMRSGFNHTFKGDAAVAAAGAWNNGLSHGGLNNALQSAIDAGFNKEIEIRRAAQPRGDLITGRHPDACGAMAEQAQKIANFAIKNAGGDFAKALLEFDSHFATLYAGHPLRTGEDAIDFANRGADTRNAWGLLGESGFDPQFQQGNASNDQTHHFATYFSGALNDNGAVLRIHRGLVEDQPADIRLGDAAQRLGNDVRSNPGYLKSIGSHIQARICDHRDRPVP